MISRKTILGLMAGASVGALVLAAPSARAQFFLSGPHTGDVTCPVDFPCNLNDTLVITDDFSTDGNVIVDHTIAADEFGVIIEDDASIGGAFQVTDDGSVTAFDADADFGSSEALAVGIVDLADSVPNIDIDGEVSAEAIAVSASLFSPDLALAVAAGNVHLHEGSASDTINGELDAEATASSLSFFGDSFAIALAAGDTQILFGDEDGTPNNANVEVGESGSVDADATAIAAVGAGSDKVGLAAAGSLGVTQVIIDGNDPTATAEIDGTVESEANAEVIYGGEDGIGIAIALAGGVNQIVLGGNDDGTASALVDNDGTIDSSAEAHVHETDDGDLQFGLALALADGVGQVVVADDNATATVTNESQYSIHADADALADGEEDQIAIAGTLGVGQLTIADTASDSIDNTGAITSEAQATTYVEHGFGVAAAFSSGTAQAAFAGDGGGSADLQNGEGGYIGADSTALVVGTNDDEEDGLDFVGAFAVASGASQLVVTDGEGDSDGNGDGSANIDNAGTLTASADATAIGQHEIEDGDLTFFEPEGLALAVADAQAADQTVIAEGDATITFTNSSSETLSADAESLADAEVAIAVSESGGVSQFADATNVTEDVDNTGIMTSSAEATANGFFFAGAFADADNVDQTIDADETGAATVENGEGYEISSESDAEANSPFFALAISSANAVHQDVDTDGDGSASVVNHGTIVADADATATATIGDAVAPAILEVPVLEGIAVAVATAEAVDQEVNALPESDDANTTATVSLLNDSTNSVDASAEATADGLFSSAFAFSTAVDQDADADGTATTDVTNSGEISSDSNATSHGEFFSLAVAGSTAVSQEVGDNADTGTATVYNDYQYDPETGELIEDSGSIDADATAYADGSSGKIAKTLDATPVANPADTALAFADATGVEQEVEADIAEADVFNTGSISASARATAIGIGDGYERMQTLPSVVDAEANATGVDQDTEGDTSATNYVTNDFPAAPPTDGGGDPEDATVSDGSSPTPQPIQEIPRISAYANALAQGQGYSGVEDIDFPVYAEANATGVEQEAQDSSASSNEVYNGGEIEAWAQAEADGFNAAEANAFATGVDQTVDNWDSPDTEGGDTGTNLVTNYGSISADAYATAGGYPGLLECVELCAATDAAPLDEGSGSGDSGGGDGEFHRPIPTLLSGDGEAFASAAAIYQDAEDSDTGTSDVENYGELDAYADAYAKAYDADAVSQAAAVVQEFSEDGTANAVLYNYAFGEMRAEAVSVADGDAFADSYAAGYLALGDTHGDGISDFVLDVHNYGNIDAEASSEVKFADGFANAEAVGIDVAVFAAEEYQSQGEVPGVEGEIENAWIIDVDATATGPNVHAHAIGIRVDAPEQEEDILNTGFIDVEASTHYTGLLVGTDSAEAEGIVVSNDESDLEDVDASRYEVTNDSGAIVTRQYSGIIGGGEEEDYDRGTAIDTEDGPGEALIYLMGNNPDGLGAAVAFGDLGDAPISDFLQTVFQGQTMGYIVGDIETSDEDEIIVTDGKTLFDGVVNPESEGEGGNLRGELTITGPGVDDDGIDRAGGTLVLLQNDDDGPSEAHVREFNLDDGGTLMVELTTEDDLVPGVEAETANVNGRIFALYNPGFYDDETHYQDVVETAQGGLTVGDTFTVEDNSALLQTEAVVEDDSIDLVTTRQGFGALEGLSHNQRAVGNAIERVFDAGLDPESQFGHNVANLFVLADGEYQDFLKQISGAEFANYLQSVLWSTRTIKRTITERMECDAGYAAGAVANVNGLQVKPTADLAPEALGCFTPGTGHIWGRGSGTFNNLDGDNNAPGYDETQVSFTVGADYAFTDSFYAGIAGGWISSEMNFDNFGHRKGASVDYEGWHVAGYGGYDNRVFYLRGIVDFASYDGESHRDIRQGISLVDPSSNEADSSVLDFYGEAGYRWEFSPNYTLTPFVGVDVGHAELDSFSEKDPHDTGWALKVRDSEADSVETLVGGRFGGFWDMAGGVFRPEVMVAWAHEFEDPAEVDVAFRDAPHGASFSVEATDVAQDSIVAQVGGTFDVTNQLQFGIKWDGRFNEDYDSQSIIGRMEYKF